MRKNKSGFTIVELLIVIVVIGILAAITIVAYNGVQQRSRDAIRKADLTTIAKAFQAYNIDTDSWMGTGSGCGYQGNGWGWFNRENDSLYGTSINDCLIASGHLSNDVIDPTGQVSSTPTTGYGYMYLACGSGDTQRAYAYAKLETEPQTSTATNGTCNDGFDTSYGMNYFVRIR